MSQEPNRLNVKLLDRQFQFKCEPDHAETLQMAAAHLDNKMRQLQQTGTVGYEKNCHFSRHGCGL